MELKYGQIIQRMVKQILAQFMASLYLLWSLAFDRDLPADWLVCLKALQDNLKAVLCFSCADSYM